MLQLSLEPFHIQRPEKIRWRANIQDRQILDSLKSESLKAFLTQTDHILAEHHISVRYQQLSKPQYLDWLLYYQDNMMRHGYDVIATAEWYDSREALGREIYGMFLEQDTLEGKKIVASGIITRQGNEIATFAFKASERIKVAKDNKGSLGALIDYLFLREMRDSSVKNISAGRSRNSFGVFNTIGYLSFNLRFGFVPAPAEDAQLLSTVPISSTGNTLFYGVKNDAFTLFCAKEQESPTDSTDFAQLSQPEIPYQEIIYSANQLTTEL